jgi:hypothetical protein
LEGIAAFRILARLALARLAISFVNHGCSLWWLPMAIFLYTDWNVMIFEA